MASTQKLNKTKSSASAQQISQSKQAMSSSAVSAVPVEDLDGTVPFFIYGGPFIKLVKPEPFLNTATPINLQLQGTFKKSFAYLSLKDRMPVILTKVIDYMSRENAKIRSGGATDQEIQNVIQSLSKLKNDLATNKEYEKFTIGTPEAELWNKWIDELDNKRYFTNTWVFSECYVYRKIAEFCELNKGLSNFDPFEDQKAKAFANSLEPMCLVASKLQAEMLAPSEKDKRKADFQLLLKVCLWSNKCDLSLSMGEEVTLLKSSSYTNPDAANRKVMDPFQMIIDYKDKLLVDDTGKAADQIPVKAENILKAIDGQKSGEAESPPPAVPTEGAEGEEEPKIPCPAKMTIPSAVMFDIVCDNAGYELFTDLCFAHFLISQNIVQKIRFHVKKYPWFVSDVTPKDFKYVINECMNASYNREIPPEPKPAPPPGAEAETAAEPPEPPRVISADSLRSVAAQWNQYVEDGTFIVQAEDYWTYPHVYKDMKKYEYNLYRKLQLCAGILFKGDLNYRKLLGERNCNPSLGFEAALQGFIPAPIIAVRTVKADLICGLPKGKWDQLTNLDPKWMQTGDYGVIQYCAKAEPLKVSDRPCLDYGDACRGLVCPTHKDM